MSITNTRLTINKIDQYLRRDSIYELPIELVAPSDDGACAHLVGQNLPNLSLSSTNGCNINLADYRHKVALFCYPRTGNPCLDPPSGWDKIPGARGCTPQLQDLNIHLQQFQDLGVKIFALSTQTTTYQSEMSSRLKLKFDTLSDSNLAFSTALHLPLFSIANMQLLKRMILIADNAKIMHVIYPVFPPNISAQLALDYFTHKGTS